MQKIKVNLLISIDEWDKYAQEWKITSKEIYKNGEWYIKISKDIADNMINEKMAELIIN